MNMKDWDEFYAWAKAKGYGHWNICFVEQSLMDKGY